MGNGKLLQGVSGATCPSGNLQASHTVFRCHKILGCGIHTPSTSFDCTLSLWQYRPYFFCIEDIVGVGFDFIQLGRPDDFSDLPPKKNDSNFLVSSRLSMQQPLCKYPVLLILNASTPKRT